ncbi:hypothetical protein GQ42DRAFT_160098 [Ramicandelaber brevisporus]|nr:hypothetical protein GQ42DRAFT_160098 [Ramicandelaber brevisporus]
MSDDRARTRTRGSSTSSVSVGGSNSNSNSVYNPSTSNGKVLAQADTLFTRHTVAELVAIESSTRADVGRKRQELRAVVGEHYRQIIAATDSLAAMKKSTASLLAGFAHLTSTQTDTIALKAKANQARISASRTGNALPAEEDTAQISPSPPSEQGRMSYAAVAAVPPLSTATSAVVSAANEHRYSFVVLSKLLLEVPEHVWRAVDRGDFIHAALLCLAAEASYSHLQSEYAQPQSTTSSSASNKKRHDENLAAVLAECRSKFPFVRRQWTRVSQLRSQVLAKCDAVFSNKRGSNSGDDGGNDTKWFLHAAVARLILEKCSIDDLLAHIVSVCEGSIVAVVDNAIRDRPAKASASASINHIHAALAQTLESLSRVVVLVESLFASPVEELITAVTSAPVFEAAVLKTPFASVHGTTGSTIMVHAFSKHLPAKLLSTVVNIPFATNIDKQLPVRHANNLTDRVQRLMNGSKGVDLFSQLGQINDVIAVQHRLTSSSPSSSSPVAVAVWKRPQSPYELVLQSAMQTRVVDLIKRDIKVALFDSIQNAASSWDLSTPYGRSVAISALTIRRHAWGEPLGHRAEQLSSGTNIATADDAGDGQVVEEEQAAEFDIESRWSRILSGSSADSLSDIRSAVAFAVNPRPVAVREMAARVKAAVGRIAESSREWQKIHQQSQSDPDDIGMTIVLRESISANWSESKLALVALLNSNNSGNHDDDGDGDGESEEMQKLVDGRNAAISALSDCVSELVDTLNF